MIGQRQSGLYDNVNKKPLSFLTDYFKTTVMALILNLDAKSND